MIYQAVSEDQPICQGDIFRGIPNVQMSLSQLIVYDEPDTEDNGEPVEVRSWDEVLKENTQGEKTEVTALLPIESVYGIVITQNCDAARGRDLCLCEISPFLPAVGQENAPSKPGKWNNLILKHMRSTPRIFYLPQDATIGFTERMAADFRSVLRVPRKDLYELRHLRIARLVDVAYDHFRESLGQFFRRYAFNEWYPLDREEADAYAEGCPESIDRYPWQQ